MVNYTFDSKSEVHTFIEYYMSKKRDDNPESFQHNVERTIKLSDDMYLLRVTTDRKGEKQVIMKKDGHQYVSFFPKATHMAVSSCYNIIDQIEPHSPFLQKTMKGKNAKQDFIDYLNVDRFPNKNIITWEKEDVVFNLIDSKYLFVMFHIAKHGDYVGFFLDKSHKRFLEALPDDILNTMTHDYIEAPSKHRENKISIEDLYDRYSVT